MTRPRGFIKNWTPSTSIRLDEGRLPRYRHSPAEIVALVQEILEQYEDILPLTLRQIFYVLVSGYGFEKTDQAYKRLCEIMNKGRRARMVSMAAIRDDGLTELLPGDWEDGQQFHDAFQNAADNFKLERQEGQDAHIFLWCEAAGMAPQLQTAVATYGVTVISSGGFDSLTTKHDMAVKIAEFDAVEILHIGDHDPSGVHICSSLDEDLQAFVEHYGGGVTVTRLAVTPAQVEEMDLPTAPAKSTDKRKFSGRTTQAEAIPPRRLREIVVAAIESRTDFAIRDELLEREREIRNDLSFRVGNL